MQQLDEFIRVLIFRDNLLQQRQLDLQLGLLRAQGGQVLLEGFKPGDLILLDAKLRAEFFVRLNFGDQQEVIRRSPECRKNDQQDACLCQKS